MSFIPVRIGTLRPDDVISFDVFVQVGERFIHYIRSSDPFDGDRIQRLKDKGVKKLFIPEQSEPAYLAYLDAGLNRLASNDVPVQDRTELVRDALVTDAENAIHNVETQAGYERTENRMQKIAQFLTSDQGVAKTILATAGCSQDIFQHSANVSTLALGLAPLCGLDAATSVVELGLAALLHDVGHAKTGFNVRTPRSKLAGEALAQYHAHPKDGVITLQDKPYINRSILELIADHEEIGNGLGFPEKKRLMGLGLSQQILNLCNDYDRYSLLHNVTHREVAKTFFQERIGCFDMNHIKFLMTLLKN